MKNNFRGIISGTRLKGKLTLHPSSSIVYRAMSAMLLLSNLSKMSTSSSFLILLPTGMFRYRWRRTRAAAFGCRWRVRIPFLLPTTRVISEKRRTLIWAQLNFLYVLNNSEEQCRWYFLVSSKIYHLHDAKESQRNTRRTGLCRSVHVVIQFHLCHYHHPLVLFFKRTLGFHMMI